MFTDLNDGEFDLTIYVPTKGRPDKIYNHETNFYARSRINTRLVYILSANDPMLEKYLNLTYINEDPYIIVNPDRPGFVDPLNKGYLIDRRKIYSYAVGFMGDDHFPRTDGWDEQLVDALLSMKSGFTYGNDLLQGEAIPTHIAMTSDIPLTLGFMTLPQLLHLYADNFWLDLGKSVNKLKYCSEVVIEHMHPGAGKANYDAGYEFSGAHMLDMRDKAEYTKYLEDDLEGDTRKLINMMRRTGKL